MFFQNNKLMTVINNHSDVMEVMQVLLLTTSTALDQLTLKNIHTQLQMEHAKRIKVQLREKVEIPSQKLMMSSLLLEINHYQYQYMPVIGQITRVVFSAIALILLLITLLLSQDLMKTKIGRSETHGDQSGEKMATSDQLLVILAVS